jgi:hypothetical protein
VGVNLGKEKAASNRLHPRASSWKCIHAFREALGGNNENYDLNCASGRLAEHVTPSGLLIHGDGDISVEP